MKYVFIFFSIILLMLACDMESPIQKAAESITKESLKKPIEVLSSDKFQGRGTGTVGDQKAIDYLIRTLKEYGIRGGMPDSSYVQRVPLIGQKVDKEAKIEIKKDGKTIHTFNYYTDFMVWPSNLQEKVSIQEAPLVYVGYGIQAPEEKWDDFKKADVEGKILVVKNNDPSEKPDAFNGKTRLYYGRYDYKYEKAQEMGALGVLIIHTTPTAGYGWNVVANSWNSEQFYLQGAESVRDVPTKFNGWLRKESSQLLFKEAGLNLLKQLDAAEDRDFRPVSLNGLRLSINLNATYRKKNTENVLGVIPGTKEYLKDQYMVFTAHHDHLGITKPMDGDSINNGALDNAAGVSAVLNLARAYKKLQPQLKRSVLFLFVGAEEVGLLGSKYWANHPTVPLPKVTANINLDGMNVYGKTRDLVLIGYGRNTVSDVIEKVASKNNRVVKPDPHPERGYFYRSDHFKLAKKGIPAVFPSAGSDFIDKGDGYAAKIDSLEQANYHTVNDEINNYWDLSGMVRDVQLFFKAGYLIINAENIQTWHNEDEFKSIRQHHSQSDK